MAVTEPTYLRIYEKIRQSIEAGEFADLKLPSERNLMADLDGTRITVREALMRLEQEGTIYRLNRRGWFVAPPRISYSPHHKSHFTQAALAQGRKPKTLMLKAEPCRVEGELAQQFAQQQEVETNHLVRLRELDAHPALYESIWLNSELTPEILSCDLNGSLTELMRNKYQLEVRRTKVRVRPCVLTGEVAERLLVRDGTAGLSIKQWRFDQQGRLLEYDEELWRNDVIELEINSED